MFCLFFEGFFQKNLPYFFVMEDYSQDGEFSQSQGQGWSQNSPWMTFSQPQFQPISPQMHVSNFDRFGTRGAGIFSPLRLPGLSGSNLRQSIGSSAGIFLPLQMPRNSGLDLQQSSEEVTPNENAKNALMDVKEEEAIFAAAKALTGEDVPTSKKRGRPSKGGKTSAPPTKKKSQKTTKKAAKEVVDLGGDSSSEEEGSTRKWRDYEVETLIAIRGEMDEEFSRCAKKQGMLSNFFPNFFSFFFPIYDFLYFQNSLEHIDFLKEIVGFTKMLTGSQVGANWGLLKAFALARCELPPPNPPMGGLKIATTMGDRSLDLFNNLEECATNLLSPLECDNMIF